MASDECKTVGLKATVLNIRVDSGVFDCEIRDYPDIIQIPIEYLPESCKYGDPILISEDGERLVIKPRSLDPEKAKYRSDIMESVSKDL